MPHKRRETRDGGYVDWFDLYGEKKKCTVCDFTGSPTGMRLHMRLRHRMAFAPNTTICETCQREFESDKDYFEHLRYLHRSK